jgi:hypothetical protein
MRTAKYSDFLARMRAFSGVESLLTTEETHFNQYFNSNIKYAWEQFEWPELCPMEERSPLSGGILPLSDTGLDDIGEVYALWTANPLINGSNPREVQWVLTPDGIQLTGEDLDSTVWVNYKLRCPTYEGAAYAGATAYAIDDQAYYATTGRYYRAIAATTGNLPTDTGYWREVEIPYCLFEYVVRASFADALTAEGFDEKANRQRANAQAWLVQEIEKVSRQQRQGLRYSTIKTHANQQYRNY